MDSRKKENRMRITADFLRKKERMEIALTTLIEYYATSRQIKGCSSKTVIGIRSNLGKFIAFLTKRNHSLKLSDLVLEDARAYVAFLQGTVTKYEDHKLNRPIPNCTYTPQTVHTHVRALRSFSFWLEKEGYTSKLIFERLELPKLPKKKIDVLSPEEIQHILSAINPETVKGARLSAMVLLMLDTGIRVGELVGMKLSDIDWNRGVFKVMGKGAKERFVPFAGTAKIAIHRYIQVYRPKPAREDIDNVFLALDGYPLTVNAVVHMMAHLAKNSGVERLHAHLLRHTCGVLYLLDDGDTKSLQMFLGHSSPYMTNHYEQFKDEHVLAQHRKHSPLDSLGITFRRLGRKRGFVLQPKQNGRPAD